MYTRKRQRGGASIIQGPNSRGSARKSRRSDSKSKRRSSKITSKSKLSDLLPCLQREISLDLEVIRSKCRNLRTCIVQKACRITMLEKIVLSILRPQLNRMDITENSDVREMLDKIIGLLLKDRHSQLYKFIMMNDQSQFTGVELTQEIITRFETENRTRKRKSMNNPMQKVLPIVISRKINGIIGHYLLLIYQNGTWYTYESYGSELVLIEPSKVEVNIQEFLRFSTILKKETMNDEEKAFVEDFIQRVFLPEGYRRQAMNRDAGTNRLTYPKIETGIQQESKLYTGDTQFGVLYIPSLYQSVKELLGHEEIQRIIRSYKKMNSIAEENET